MPKWKRGSEEGANPPVRKSLRLQNLRDRTVQVEERSSQLPSSSPSHSPDRVLGKRKKSSAGYVEDVSPPKRRRSSEDNIKAHSPSANHLVSQESEHDLTGELPDQQSGNKDLVASSPIRHWAETQSWPKNFAKIAPMVSRSSRPLKRQKTGSGPSQETGRSTKQYSKAYEAELTKSNIIMKLSLGGTLISKDSKAFCTKLLKINYATFETTVIPEQKIVEAVEDSSGRNEDTIRLDLTQLIVPPIVTLHWLGEDGLSPFTHEVNNLWSKCSALVGPRPKPDYVVGLLESAFSEDELQKLRFYTAPENATKVSELLFFPFLLCEVKSSNGALLEADRQNMHSCTIAVKAILKLEEAADRHRLEHKLFKALSGQVLVYSISHDDQIAFVYGHYGVTNQTKWSFHRYRIKTFSLTDKDDLLAVHNFCRNIYSTVAPAHLKRIQEALAAFPDAEKPSLEISESSLDYDSGSQQSGDADGSSEPAPSDSQDSEAARTREQNDKLIQQSTDFSKQLSQLTQKYEMEKQDEREREKQERKEWEEKTEQRHKEQMEQLRQEGKERMEQQRQESREQMDKLLQALTASK